ncbi:MAG TPA: hypothetical protein PK948_06140 [Gemmatimonadales bacterium]|jgi:hypothetical protein|nr:hypothetical protein [Gemmatimonadales bacterium]
MSWSSYGTTNFGSTTHMDVPATREIRVWTAKRAIVLRSVRFPRDSVTGVPVDAPRGCDSCRVAYPLRAVDSMQSGSSEALPVILLGAAGIFFLAAIVTNDTDQSADPAAP